MVNVSRHMKIDSLSEIICQSEIYDHMMARLSQNKLTFVPFLQNLL